MLTRGVESETEKEGKQCSVNWGKLLLWATGV